MPRVKKVGVKDLKNNLSAHLREVRKGTRILVSDRNTVVAELHEPAATYGPVIPDDPIIAEWVASGILTLPSREKTPLPESPVRLPDGTALRVLDEDRKERM